MRNIKFYLMLLVAGVIVIGGGIVFVTGGRVVGQFLFGRSFAESQLKNYVSSVYKQQINGATCQAMDTDSNGYVSCDYTIASEPNATYSIECAAWGLDGFFNRGCKSRILRPYR